jgi:hypothetical protein
MKRIVWLAVLVIAIGAYVGYGQMTNGAGKKPEPGRREGRPPVPVTVVAAVQKIMCAGRGGRHRRALFHRFDPLAGDRRDH